MRVRAAVVVTCAIFWLFATVLFYLACFRARSPIFAIIVGITFAFFAIYIWQLRAWARQVARYCFAFLIFLFVGGIYNPFYMMDYHAAHGVDPDYLIVSLLGLPCVAVAWWCLCILGKFPEEFR
jgi:hypothetical protein